MKVKRIEISNFRSIESEIIECEDYNVFVGPNGSGKSTVLNALNLFFGEISSFSESDFHGRDTTKSIEIKVTFYDFDEHSNEEFKHYIRNNELVVSAEVSKKDTGGFERVVRGERLIYEPFQSFFQLPKSPAADRAKVFNTIRETYPEVSKANSDGAREKSLRDYEEQLPEEEKKLVKSGGDFFGISKGTHKFKRHINWVYIPAVKDATTESEEGKSSHLGKLIQHTIRSGMQYEGKLQAIKDQALLDYKKLLQDQKRHLDDLETRLSNRLKSAVTTNAKLELDWKSDEKSVSVLEPTAQVLLMERGFSGGVENFGHGLQRTFLIAILQELMEFDSEVSPALLLGCEEPELYQHPPQAKYLASILSNLSKGDAQIFATSHSPYFINIEHYNGIKKFQDLNGKTTVSHSNFQSILDKYNEAYDKKPLQNEDQIRTKLAIQTQPKYNEIFFADQVVLVEGISDHAYLEAYLQLSGRQDDFRRRGASVVVCEGKSSLVLLLLIAQSFNVPTHVIFDCDAGAKDAHPAHKKDNTAIFNLTGITEASGFPDTHIMSENVTAWTHDIESLLEEEFGADAEGFVQKGREAVGHLGQCKKYPLYVATIMNEAWSAGKKFEPLKSAVDNILK